MLKSDANIQRVHEFSSARKKMSTIVKERDHVPTYLKSDPDFCLDICTHYLTAQGERLETTETIKQQILYTMIIAYSDLGNEMKEEYNDASIVSK